MTPTVMFLAFGLAAHGPPAVAPSATPAGALSAGQWAELAALLSRVAERSAGTGAVLSVADDVQVCTLAHGTRGADGAAMQADTLFNLASVSKVLTASHVVASAHSGRLDLDASVGRYLPGVILLDPAGRDATSEVTLRRLLQHQGGLPHQPGEQLRPEVFENRWDRPDLLQKLTERWALRLAHVPGETHYSNMGYVLLGAVVSKVEACDFADCMGRHLRSYSLPTATFRPSGNAGSACDGRVRVNGLPAFHSPGWYESAYAAPFSGAWMSMPELARFGDALRRAADSSTAPLHGMTVPPPGGRGFGLGIVNGRIGTPRSLEHDGSGPGFMARLVVLPERGRVLAIASNGGNESREEGQAFHQLTEAMLTVVLGEPPALEKAATAGPTEPSHRPANATPLCLPLSR